MSERSRKRSEIAMPGEGTGIPGVDPLVYREAGDNPALEALLFKLRGSVSEAPQAANSQAAERLEEPRAPKGKGGASARDPQVAKREGTEGASEQVAEKAQGGERAFEQGAPRGKEAVKRGVNPQWLTFAMVAIVGPVIVLLLVLLMSRTHAPTAGTPERTAKEMPQAVGASPAMPLTPTAAPSATVDVVPAAPEATALPSVSATPSATQIPSTTTAPPALTGTPRGPERRPAARISTSKVEKTPEF